MLSLLLLVGCGVSRVGALLPGAVTHLLSPFKGIRSLTLGQFPCTRHPGIGLSPQQCC